MSSLNDIVGGANLFGGQNYFFTKDRFGKNNSAIYFKSGYLQVPAGAYFAGDFTVLAWIKLNSYQNWQRIIDFGSSNTSTDNLNDRVTFCFYKKTGKLDINIGDYAKTPNYETPTELQLNEWYHVAYALEGFTGTIYVNGVNVISGEQSSPDSLIRSYSYVGKSFGNDPYADATYDEIKIYNEALRSSDIMKDYMKTKA